MDIKEKLEKYYDALEPGEAAEILANCPTYAHACKALSADAAAEILEKCKLSEIIKNEGLSPEILTNGKVSAETAEEYKVLTEFYRRVERINKRLVEDAKDFSFPDNPAKMLAEYKAFADTLGDDRKRRFYIQVLIRTANDNLGKGDRDGFKLNMLRLRRFRKALLNDRNSAKVQKGKVDAGNGGRAHHAGNRKLFKNDYRGERGTDPTNVKPRSAIIAGLRQYYPDVVDATLENWAKKADEDDVFIRKGGRPKKGG